MLPSADEIRAAARRLAPHIRRTVLRRSVGMSDFLGGDVWLKPECEQVTGSFKIRGATNALASLDSATRAKGVVTASSGNHGLGIATAASELGIPATVYLPSSAPPVKRERIIALGAAVDATATNYDAAERLALAHAERTGATFVSPTTGNTLLAGQGTIALEVLEDLPGLRTLIVPIGGTGLVTGIGAFLRAEKSHVRIVGAQSDRTNAVALAFASGQPTEIPSRKTLADGLSGSADAIAIEQARAVIHEIAVASEEDIASAMAFLWIEEGLKVEGAGAAGVAVLLADRIERLEFPVAIVLSGGNVDEEKHRAVIAATYPLEDGAVSFPS
ncbi:MAG TPA: threonine/serine dehydratase [Gemmatimonadaceae bacterium]|nr:threonine/serine dehydratase [Gemmatimonadaceae bacterium]